MEGKVTGQFANQEKNGVDQNQDPIELIFCPQDREGSNCKEHRAVINQSMLASRRHVLDKEYQVSIAELKTAFYKTVELKEATCQRCADFYRSTITQSLEQIHDDLRKMSGGIFRGKHYKASFEQASEVLEEFRKHLK